MKKLLSLFLLFILMINAIFCSDNKYTPEYATDYNFTLIPYYGGVGVNLGSLLYPQHIPSAVGVEWKSWDGKDQNANTSIFSPDASNSYYSKYYSDYHIIALGGAYNIPFSAYSNDYVDNLLYNGLSEVLNLPSDARNILIPKENIVLTVDVICNTNFEFVSQSNPIYRRPFEIEIFPRIRTANNGDTGDPYTEEVKLIESGATQYEIKMPDSDQTNVNFNDNYLTMIAADMVLVLPYDYSSYETGGGYFSGGLKYNNATYTLADLDDYTAVVTVTLTFSFEYSYETGGEYVYGGWYGGERKTDVYTDQRVIAIPFSGFFTSSGSRDVRESSISLYVNATNEAANLNLERQGEWINVGSIQFLFSEKGENNTPSANEDIVRIFLSASPHPEVQSPSKFRMVHENATKVITNTNSLGFTARIRGIGSSAGDILLSSTDSVESNVVEFDGLAYMGNIAGGATPGEVGVVKTKHYQERISNNWDVGNRHFHTFEGDVDIKFDESAMLEAGIYRGYIYVHAVTED